MPTSNAWTRRRLLRTLPAAALAAPLSALAMPRAAREARSAAAGDTRRLRPIAFRAQPFPLAQVRLLDGPCRQSRDLNISYLRRLPVDRLVRNFQTNAGLSSAAQPFGGWEKPDCELRGHFTGHYLSACALASAATGDAQLKANGNEVVSELSRCQAALGGGYLSAFPREFWDRLNARQPVWAPFYTIHKIMAGLLDMHVHCGNRDALEMVQRMAGWVDDWTRPIPEEHMQQVLQTEFGGMGEVLVNLAGVTGETRFAEIARRFDHKRIFDPLALHRDELKGLHVNTQVPKMIGLARRYELFGDARDRHIAEYFWYEVTGARSYCTGGTSNNEQWLTDPFHLAEELAKHADTNECCVAYNMMKLTRHLYQWTADPRYFDYYERALFNHRLGTLHPQTGGSAYYLPLRTGSWKIYSTEQSSFWCCTGTGVEEHARLNDSIYFHDDDGAFVNLFIASQLDWPEKGFFLRQTTAFPEQDGTTLAITAAKPVQLALRIRIPSWTRDAVVKVNGAAVNASASPGSYLVLNREWKSGDKVEVRLPMSVQAWPMPDDETQQAFMYGPLVLAGILDAEKISGEKLYGVDGPGVGYQKPTGPREMRAAGTPAEWIKRAGSKQLAFHTTGQSQDVSLLPLYRVLDQRYGIYWRVT